MRSFRSLWRQVEALKRQEAEAPPAFNLATTYIKLLAGASMPEEELAAFLQVWEEAQRAAEQRPTLEERMAEALGEQRPRPCGLRELRPDERLLTNGGDQERAD
jgi:hypothetical protein